jgi:hypothetical protein
MTQRFALSRSRTAGGGRNIGATGNNFADNAFDPQHYEILV